MKTLLFLFLLLPASFVSALDANTEKAYRLGVSGRAHVISNKTDKAMDHFNQSLALKPDSIIYSNRADLKRSLGDFQGAIEDLDKAIATNSGIGYKPSEIHLLYSKRGLFKLRDGDFAGAVADYGKTLSLSPKEAIHHYNLGVAKYMLGDLAGAAGDYAKAVALEPKKLNYLEYLANAKRDQGDFAGALADLDKRVAIDPKNPESYYFRGNLKQLTGDFTGAVMDYEKVISLMPEYWAGYLKRGMVLQAQGKFEAALADYDKAVSVSKEPLPVSVYREAALRSLKRETPKDEILKLAQKNKDGLPKSIGLFLGGALSEADFLAGAKAPSEKCIAAYFTGMSRLWAGDREGARKLLEQSTATKSYGTAEFVLARSELTRLAKKP